MKQGGAQSIVPQSLARRALMPSFGFFLSLILFFALFTLIAPSNVFADANSVSTYADLEITVGSDGRSVVTGSSNVPIADIAANETLYGHSDLFTTKKQTAWTFNLTIDEVVNVSFIKVHLPQNVIINHIDSALSSNIAYDDSITVTFVGREQPISLAIQYVFENASAAESDSGTVASKMSQNASFSLYALLAATVLTLIGVGTFWYRTRNKNKTHRAVPNSKKRVPTKTGTPIYIEEYTNVTNKSLIDEIKLRTLRPTLNETQLKIIDTLIACGGTATQNKIHHATNIPKASLSRNIDLLSRKQILQKMSGGYTNQISFADAIKKQ